jgi:hypothetical protein
MLWVCGRELP